MSEPVEIQFNVPGKDEPGYLRRARKALYFQEVREKGEMSLEVFDELVDFLLEFVSEPKDRKEAYEALLDASENQLMEVNASILGNDAVPLPNSDGSVASSKEPVPTHPIGPELSPSDNSSTLPRG